MKRHSALRQAWCLLALLAGLAAVSPRLFAQQADLILHNGKVVTVDKGFSIVQAIAVTGNKISAVGTDDAVLKTAGPNTVKIDLKGREVIPGLIDTHIHILGGWPRGEEPDKLRHFSVDWKGVKNKQDVIAQMTGIMQKYHPPAGEWLLFNNELQFMSTDQSTTAEAKILYDDMTRYDLDRIAPNNPIVLTMGIPDENGLFINSKAIEIVWSKYGDFIKKYGRYWIGSNGQPDGHLEPPATRVLLNEYTPRPTGEQMAPGIKTKLEELSSQGVTTISTKLRNNSIDAYKLLEQRSQQAVRMGYGEGFDYFGTITNLDDLKKYEHIVGSGSDMNWVTSFAPTSLDGSSTRACTNLKRQAGGELGPIDQWFPVGQCHMDSEYKGGPARSANISGNYFQDWIMSQGKYGIRFGNDHVAGDRGIADILSIIERVQKQYGKKATVNWAMDHCYLVDPKDFKRLANDGVMLSCYPRTLASNDGVQNIANTYGVKVANTFVQPIQSMLNAGVRVSFESDNGTSNKWADLSYFIIRKDMRGRLWGPQDRVDHPTALKLFTSYAADYVMRLDKMGSLEVGKLADMAVLNKDFLTIPDDEVKTVLSDLTITDGKIRYLSPSFSQEYNLKPDGAVIDTFQSLAQKSRTSGAVGQ